MQMNRRDAQRLALMGLIAPALSLPGLPAWAQEANLNGPSPALGSKAPVLKGLTNDQKPFDLDVHKGKVTLVAFWATWCPTCRVEMPEFRKHAESWNKQGFELVTVAIDKNFDDVMTYEKLVEKTVPVSQRFAQLWRGNAKHTDGFGKPPSTPTAYVIDRKGNVVHQFRGRMMADQWALIERELAKKA
jgi:thiol-disulfide isomerase/thioredoxin